jgi:hypothetical protein
MNSCFANRVTSPRRFNANLPGADESVRIRAAVERTFARPATADETRLLTQHASRHGLAAACRLLFNSNEFIFVDDARRGAFSIVLGRLLATGCASRRTGSISTEGLATTASTATTTATVSTSTSTSTTTPRGGDPVTAVRGVLSRPGGGLECGQHPGIHAGYSVSADTRFASGGSVTRGWLTVLKRYQSRYTDRKAMGQLTFSELEFTVLGPDSILVFGHWRLQREADHPGGSVHAGVPPDGERLAHRPRPHLGGRHALIQ